MGGEDQAPAPERRGLARPLGLLVEAQHRRRGQHRQVEAELLAQFPAQRANRVFAVLDQTAGQQVLVAGFPLATDQTHPAVVDEHRAHPHPDRPGHRASGHRRAQVGQAGSCQVVRTTRPPEVRYVSALLVGLSPGACDDR